MGGEHIAGSIGAGVYFYINIDSNTTGKTC